MPQTAGLVTRLLASTSVLLAALVAVLAVAFGGRVVGAIGIDGLTMIAMLGSAQFAISFLARWTNNVLAVALGPLAIFVAGLGNEGLTSLVLATTVVLAPRIGTLTLANVTVFLLNGIFSGQLGLTDLVFVGTSVAVGELALGAAGVTAGPYRLDRHRLGPWGLARLALAIGAANAGALGLQYCLYQVWFRLMFAPWYVAAVTLITGLGYGALGAAVGGRLGRSLRSVAR